MDVLFERALIGGNPPCGQKVGLHALRKDLEEGYWIRDSLEVGGDVNSAAAFSPMDPVDGVFLVYFRRKPLVHSFM